MSDTPANRPKVGVGILAFKDGKVLLGRRIMKNHGDGFYTGPGGHLEFGETIEECAAREAMEEAGIEIENVQVVCMCNFILEGKHYIDIGVTADWKSGEPEVREPDKRKDWSWFDPNDLPKPIWDQIPKYFEAMKTGRLYQGTVRSK